LSEVSLVHTSGGLIGDALAADLRQIAVTGDAAFLAEVATFTDQSGKAPTKGQLEGDLTAAFASGQALWAAYAAELAEGMDTGRLRDKLLRPLLDLLGFQPQYQRGKAEAGGHGWNVTHFGWTGPNAPPLVLTSDAELDARTGGKRSAHEELQGYLNANPDLRWGLLTNGRTLRLLRDFHHTRTRGYVAFDLAAIFEAGSYPDFLALWRLAHASRFRHQPAGEGAEPTTLLEKLYDKALTAGVAAGKRLQPQVRRAVETLANGILDATPELRAAIKQQPDLGRELYRELLTVLYRLLFLLFAEQRGMLTGANQLYTETYSVSRLRARAEADDAEPRRRDLWDGFKATCRAFGDPDLAEALGVYPYNGRLFDLAQTPLTSGAACDNHSVMSAVRALTTMPVGKVRMHVDYRNLGVEELGTVYESLLDYTLQIADAPIASGGTVVHAGRAYLADLSIERADLASYYTPADLVDLLLSRSLDPLIEQRLAAAPDAAGQEQALLSLKVIDPACGSGAILVGALDRVALAVARVRSAPQEPTDTELARARRDVLQRCIYGADKDPFAVELAKVTLWIHCVVPDQPLSFLDSHIVCGDSLIGWPLLKLPAQIPTAAFEYAKASKDDKKILTKARATNNADISGLFSREPVDPVLDLPAELANAERNYLDVRRKSEAFGAWRGSDDYYRWRKAADLWTAAFFWTADYGDAPTTHDYQEAVAGRANEDLAAAAQTVLADLNPLHWPLAFPDVRAAGGFDLVVGNPPWEESASIEQEFFAQAAPRIAALTSEHRSAAIAQLSETNPSLFGRWRRYAAVQDRFAHYAKSSLRYTRTSAKVNTYVLFTELAAGLGRQAGLIVKSGIATDSAQSPVWRSLLNAGRVEELTDIVNAGASGQPVFPAVAVVERFCLLVLRSSQEAPLRASTMNFGVEAARRAPMRPWTEADLRAASPRTRTLLSTGSTSELDLALEVQRAWPTLDFSEQDGENRWQIQYSQLFNSTYAKRDGHLLREDALLQQGYQLQPDKTFLHSAGMRAVPVYEGQMANRWDHRARTFEGYTGATKYGRKPHIPWVDDEQHGDVDFEVLPRYWMPQDVAETRIRAIAGDCNLLAMRDIGRAWTDRRVMRVAPFPRLPATDKLPIIAVPSSLALRLAALMNSMVFDFLVRLHLSGGSLKPWVFDQCAAPGPDDLPPEVDALAAELGLTSRSVADAYGREPSVWNAATRPLVDARLDAIIARAYLLDRSQYETILDHFSVLRRAEEADLGEYRSKRLCLEAFDSLGGSA
jgi:hypothetical protein